MNEELKDELRKLGADVRPESELPAEVREMITRYAPGVPGRGRVGVELKRLADEQVYVYEDERLRLEVPVPPLDVFLAIVRELERLGAAGDVDAYVSVLARAFWLLHQRPRKRGLFRKRYVVPEVDEDAALTLLKVKVRRGDVAVKSLAPALFEFINHVVGGGKADGERRD